VYDWLLAGMSQAKSALKNEVLLVCQDIALCMMDFAIATSKAHLIVRPWFASSDRRFSTCFHLLAISITIYRDENRRRIRMLHADAQQVQEWSARAHRPRTLIVPTGNANRKVSKNAQMGDPAWLDSFMLVHSVWSNGSCTCTRLMCIIAFSNLFLTAKHCGYNPNFPPMPLPKNFEGLHSMLHPQGQEPRINHEQESK
jgi:hypothetical protein